jgi:putative transposase
MRRLDELTLRDLLRGEGIKSGCQRVAKMMERMGIEALYRRPNTSKPAAGHKIYPYLMGGPAVARPNRAWAMDITYIPMARTFVNLAAVSRRVLSWRVSITTEVEFYLGAVEEALAKQGKPEIFNTDQGSQFASADFTGLLLDSAIAISMDGKGTWRDNVFVERPSRRGALDRPADVEAARRRWARLAVACRDDRHRAGDAALYRGRHQARLSPPRRT